MMLYETLTGIVWRSEKLIGKHSGVGISPSNYLMELCKEGREHRIMAFIDKNKDRLQQDFYDARGLEATY
jgi:hypothetical protein